MGMLALLINWSLCLSMDIYLTFEYEQTVR